MLLRTPAVVVLLLSATMGQEVRAEADAPADGFDPMRHMRVDDVRPGMRGYGMTVFQGVDPEPFGVEVVSVMQDFGPNKAVVWVRCPDPRMQKSGPVSGMSGSPIYLWPGSDEWGEQELGTPGHGGKIIGAFAFGYGFGKDCYVGVQPIEYMIAAAARARRDEPDRRPTVASRSNALALALRAAKKADLPPRRTWRIEALAELAGSDDGGEEPPVADAVPGAMSLPVMVSSPAQAKMLKPFMAGAAMRPVALQAGGPAGNPPPWIDADAVKPRPGGVLSVPFVMGAVDLAGVGTITDVLKDGRVLGFGHAMFGEGDVAIPMATGYVHYIQPSIRSSFKLGGSLALQGAVVRDEAVGVVGRPGAEFSTWPARVHVSFQPSGLQRQYDYRMAFIPQLTAAQFAIAASMSIESDVTPGMLSTTAIDAEVTFTNGRTLSITETLPSEGGFGLTMALAPPVSAIVDNGFEPLEVAETTINVDVREGVDSATISNITLHQATVEPGRTVTVNVALQPFRSAPIQKRLKIRIPETVPDGKYPLLVSGARGYYQQRVQTRPHLQRVNDLDDLFEAVREVMSVKSTALYATLRVDSRKSLAVGRDELPHLPTSRAALLAEAASTQATPYIQTIKVIEPMPYVIEGQATFQLEVKRKDVPDD